MSDPHRIHTFPRWHSDYAIGVEEVDLDHQRLFSLIEVTFIAAQQNIGANDLQDVIRELVNYASAHFDREEELMTKIGYPFLAEHQRPPAAAPSNPCPLSLGDLWELQAAAPVHGRRPGTACLGPDDGRGRHRRLRAVPPRQAFEVRRAARACLRRCRDAVGRDAPRGVG